MYFSSDMRTAQKDAPSARQHPPAAEKGPLADPMRPLQSRPCSGRAGAAGLLPPFEPASNDESPLPSNHRADPPARGVHRDDMPFPHAPGTEFAGQAA